MTGVYEVSHRTTIDHDTSRSGRWLHARRFRIALWIAVIGGRILFAEWATGAGSRTVGQFSRDHLITGADAWTAAFVLMALAMVVGRLLTTAVVAAASHRRFVAAVAASA